MGMGFLKDLVKIPFDMVKAIWKSLMEGGKKERRKGWVRKMRKG